MMQLSLTLMLMPVLWQPEFGMMLPWTLLLRMQLLKIEWRKMPQTKNRWMRLPMTVLLTKTILLQKTMRLMTLFGWVDSYR